MIPLSNMRTFLLTSSLPLAIQLSTSLLLILLPLVVIELGLVVFSLVDLFKPERRVKRDGDITALDRLDLEVPAGALFGFLGPNGAGKTTTIRLLTGLAWPSSGRAVVAGLDPARGDLTLRRRISHQDQQSKLYGWMKGRELLEFVGRLFGFRGPDLHSRVDEVLEKTCLLYTSDAADE